MIRTVLALSLVVGFGCSNSTSSTAGNVDGAAGVDGATGVDGASASDAAVADTWTNFAQSFFATYCVRCHGPGNTKRDYSQYSQVVRDEMEIACGVNPGPDPLPGCGSFPPPKQFPIGTGPFPTDDERLRVVNWIQAGAPQ